MGVYYYNCDVCNEIVSFECVMTDLYEVLFCMNWRYRNVELTEEEKDLLPQEKFCSHTVCNDCTPLHNLYEKDSIYDDYAECVIDHFEDVLEQYRKDKDKQIFEKFIDDMKCQKCKDEEIEDQQEKEKQNKHNVLKTKLEDIIDSITKLKKAQIKEKLIELKNLICLK